MSERMDKVNQQIKREISQIIRLGDVSDPRVSMVTIMYVRTSKDLRKARVGFSVLTKDEKSIEDAQKGLDSARGRIQKLLAQRIRLRYMPELNFVYDKSIDYSFQIDSVLKDVHMDDIDEDGEV